MVFFSCAKKRLHGYGSIKFSGLRAIRVKGQFQFFRYTKGADELISNHSAPNHSYLTTLLTPYSPITTITVKPPSFIQAIRFIWRLSRLVNVANSLHVHHHAFSRISKRTSLFLGGRKGILIILLVESLSQRYDYVFL